MNNKKAQKEEIKRRWREDKKRYPSRPWLKEVSIIAIGWYRYGELIDLMSNGIRKKILTKIYWLVFHLIEITIGVSIPKTAKIGGGLRIYHFGNIFIHRDAVIGECCTLRQGVTIGNRTIDGMPPNIGNNVELGAYAQVLGCINIGNGARIGAMSVVLRDIPDNATAVGIPAKVVKTTSE